MDFDEVFRRTSAGVRGIQRTLGDKVTIEGRKQDICPRVSCFLLGCVLADGGVLSSVLYGGILRGNVMTIRTLT